MISTTFHEHHTPDNSELDFIALVKLLLRYKTAIAGFTLFFLLCAIVYLIIATPVYTARTTILPFQEIENFSQLGNLQTIASQFGIFPSSTGTLSDLFPEIFRSESLIYPLLETKFTEADNDAGETLLRYLNIKEQKRDKALRRGYDIMLENSEVTIDDRSRLIVLSVTLAQPWLAAQVANVLTERLNDFTIEYKTSNVRYIREFLEGQVNLAEDSLVIIEDRLAEFKKQNKNYLESEDLFRRYQVIEREHQARVEIWIQYRQQHELARVQEKKDTPTITVLDTAKIPVKPSHPRKMLILGLAIMMGFALGCFSVIIVDKFFKSP